jgi:AcrR family transcriptional regulator
LQVFLKLNMKRSQPIERKRRSDAQQNRERILTIAREVFSRSGANASLEEIAKKARVGPGTLYRHFPSREELLKAVYKAGVEKLAKAGQEFAATLPPIEALRSWMLLYVDFIAEKQIIAAALNTLIEDPRKIFEPSYVQIWEAVRVLVKRGIKSGDIREDLDAIDLLRALIGVANVATSPDWQKSARKLVDILISGSRPVNQGGRLGA